MQKLGKEHFVSEDVVEFEIEGMSFAYKPVSAGDELKWVHEYIDIVDKKPVQNFEKKTICKLRNLLNVPIEKELIKELINVEKEWKDLDHIQRWKVLSKLKPTLFDKIIIKINSIDSSGNTEVKKN